MVAQDGLAVGAVVSAAGGKALKPYLRWSYADKLASQILEFNPRMRGQVDSYEYVSRRMGKSFSSLIENYREVGDLDGAALVALREAQLRRRFLMMVNILPLDQVIQLEPDAAPVIGRLNEEVDDYYDMRYQTVRLQELRVQIYDTAAGQKIFDEVFRSDDGGLSLASERSARKYVGNSLVAALSNSLANGFRDSEHPAAPKAEAVLERVWRNVAQALPAGVR